MIPFAPSIMIKAHDTMTYAYDIKVCINNIISTASNIMFKAHVIMTFVYDKMVYIHNIIATASTMMMMNGQDIM